MLSTRRAQFYRLVREANDLPSDWLVAALKEQTRNIGHMTALSRLACLRILVCRDHGIPSPSGLPYPQRKKAVRKALGI
jgi:predicted DNA-binding ribbon-helix-helix protein